MSKVRFQKRPTRILKEVIESDLLTATERIVMGTLEGYYCMTNEQAYFKVSGEKSSMSVSEFEKKLRNELHPNFFVVYNPKITRDNKVEGHQIGFYVPEYKGFVPLMKVGRSGHKEIPANSQGKMVKDEKQGEIAMIFRGYVAAFEGCKAFINDVQIDGIKPSRCISAADFFLYKRMVEEIGGKERLHNAFEDGRKLAEQEMIKEQQALELKEKAEKAKQEEIIKDVEEFIKETTKENTKKVILDMNGNEIKKEVE